ncbi:MAG: hypothetical protein ACREX3_04865 [Gammaproteobacteria bacterium]
MNLKTSLKNAWDTTTSFLVPLLWIMTASWTADGLGGQVLFSEWGFELERFRIRSLLVVISLFVFSSVWIYSHRQRYLPVRTLSRRRCEPHSSLILMVSTPNLVSGELAIRENLPNKVSLGSKEITFTGNLKNDIASLDGTRWNWQQVLRAVKEHQARLNRIHLIGSKGEGGSYGWLQVCRSLLQKYFPSASINVFQKSIDFEDLDWLRKVIQQIIRDEVKQGVPEEEIIVDATGGQKTTSIAAALATLNSKVTFQYVQTTDNPEVIVYDVVSEAPHLLSG